MKLRRHEQVDVLKSVPLFSELNKRELSLIARHTDQVTVNAGQVLAKQGELGREFLILLRGKAQVTKDGKPIRTLKKGDYFGEVSLIDSGLRMATVTAETEVHLMVLHVRSFNYLLNEVPALSKKLLRSLCKYLRQAEELLTKKDIQENCRY